jgi:hypothetical protein
VTIRGLRVRPLDVAPARAADRQPRELIVGGAADPDAVRSKLERHFRLLGAQGLVAIAMAGIDMALRLTLLANDATTAL